MQGHKLPMLLNLTTTLAPATDLGFLLHKHPDRVHETELSFGKAVVFYPEAEETRCTASLMLDIDPIALVRGKRDRARSNLLDHYVNDRPYAASSFLSVAMARTYREAMAGKSKERPELAASALPLEATLTPLPVRARETDVLTELFGPLGYEVTAETQPLDPVYPDWGQSPYQTVHLKGELRLSDLLTHLYVLIPVLDNRKHYWVSEDEIDKLVSRGAGWLETHPARDFIARRYLRRHWMAREALALLDERVVTEEDEEKDEAPDALEEKLEKPIRLNDQRYDAVRDALKAEGARTICDLGCGEGKLVLILLKDPAFDRVVGVDVSPVALERAERRLKLDRMAPTQRARVDLLHGSLVYDDERLKGFDAIILVEVVEHVDAERLSTLERVVFANAHPRLVIVTTPNREYNALFEGMAEGALRHPDHRFEWTRAEFTAWAEGVAARNAYAVRFAGIGEERDALGHPTQMAVFGLDGS